MRAINHVKNEAAEARIWPQPFPCFAHGAFIQQHEEVLMKAILFAVASIFVVTVSATPSLARPYYQDRAASNFSSGFQSLSHHAHQGRAYRGAEYGARHHRQYASYAHSMRHHRQHAGYTRTRGITANKPTPHAARARHTTQPADAPPAGAAGGCAHKKAADLSSTSPAIGGIGAVPPARASAQSWSGPIMSA
jgi:hypothetical protein